MQGEQCKLFEFCLLASGRRLLYSGLRSITVTKLNTACFG